MLGACIFAAPTTLDSKVLPLACGGTYSSQIQLGQLTCINNTATRQTIAIGERLKNIWISFAHFLIKLILRGTQFEVAELESENRI